jgi:hypothetical protein
LQADQNTLAIAVNDTVDAYDLSLWPEMPIGFIFKSKVPAELETSDKPMQWLDLDQIQ